MLYGKGSNRQRFWFSCPNFCCWASAHALLMHLRSCRRWFLPSTNKPLKCSMFQGSRSSWQDRQGKSAEKLETECQKWIQEIPAQRCRSQKLEVPPPSNSVVDLSFFFSGIPGPTLSLILLPNYLRDDFPTADKDLRAPKFSSFLWIKSEAPNCIWEIQKISLKIKLST